MAIFVSLLSSGKGSWGYVSKIIEKKSYDKVFLLTNSFGKEKYNPRENTSLLEFDFNKDIFDLKKDFETSLKEHLKDEIEVDVNFISGNGKEHMAFLSAILNLGVGIRLVVLKDEEVVEL